MEHLTVEQLAEAMMELGEKEDTPLSQMTREEMDLSVFAAQGDTEAHQEAFGALMIASLKDVLEAMATGTSKGCCVVHRPDLDVNIIFLANRGLFSTSKRAISLARTHTKRRIAQQAKAEAKAAKEAKRLALRNKKKASKRANKVSKRKVIISSSESSDSDVFSGSSDVSTVYGGAARTPRTNSRSKNQYHSKVLNLQDPPKLNWCLLLTVLLRRPKNMSRILIPLLKDPEKWLNLLSEIEKLPSLVLPRLKSLPDVQRSPRNCPVLLTALRMNPLMTSPPPLLLLKNRWECSLTFPPFLVNTTWFYLLIGL